jgi:hypothetical protein
MFYQSRNLDERLLSAADAGGTRIEVASNNTLSTRVFGNAASNTSAVGTAWTGRKCLAVNYTNGEKPTIWFDGSYSAECAAALVFTANDAPIIIGAYYSGATRACWFPIATALETNRPLTATEHAQVFDELQNTKWPLRPYVVRAVEATPAQNESGLLASWDFAGGGTVPDASGNGKTLTGSNIRQQSPVGLATKLTANNYLSGAFTALPDGADCSIEGVVYLPVVTANTPVLINFNSVNVGNNSTFLLMGSSTNIHFVLWNAVNLYKRWIVDVGHHAKWLHFVYTYVHATGDTVLYINGVPTGTFAASSSGVATGAVSSIFFGRRYDGLAATLAQNEQIKFCKVHNTAKSALEAKNLYERSGLLDISDTCAWGIPVSTASRGGIAASYLENTALQFGTTTPRYTVDVSSIGGENIKVIKCGTAGVLYEATDSHFTPQQAAYGVFELSFYKGADANVIYWLPISSGQVIASSNGYCITVNGNESITFWSVMTGGAFASKFTTAIPYVAIQTWYSLRLTRTFAGLFKLWIRGGIYTTWTLVGSATDTTHSSSNYTVLDLDAGDMVSLGSLTGNYPFSWKPFA